MYASKTELGLEFLGSIDAVVDKGESSALTTSKGILETKDDDGILVSLVHGGKLLTKSSLGNTSLSRMQDVNDLQGRKKRSLKL